MTVMAAFEHAANLFDPQYTRWHLDPVGWAAECIDWQGGGLYTYQQRVLGELVDKGRVAVRGPHGPGKTTTDAIGVLWFATTRELAGLDWKVPTTADAWRQLEQYLWPEIHKWAKRIRWDVLGMDPFSTRQLLDLHLKLDYGEAFALASNDPARIEGAHADQLLYVIDEAKLVPGGTWDAIEGAFSTGTSGGREVYCLANSTPADPAGRFYDIHKRKAGYEDWEPIKITLKEAIDAGQIDATWAADRKRQWGEKSAVYINRVEGDFAASDEDSVIPLAWVEAANERYLEMQRLGILEHGEIRNVGVDVAREGADDTVLALRRKPVPCNGIKVQAITDLTRYSKADTAVTTDIVESIVMAKGVYATVDGVGVGGGVVDQLRQRGHLVVSFNAGERTDYTDRTGETGFDNKRSAAWWLMRELLDPLSLDPVALPPDDLLTGDLTAPKWRRVGPRIHVESKIEIRKRLGRSTDTGDAVIQACWPEAPVVLDSEQWGWGAHNGHKSLTGDLQKARF